jgi:hypothetical protein
LRPRQGFAYQIHREPRCTRVSGLARLLAIHGHDLHFIRVQARGIIELECNVLDDEGPDVVTKAVGIQMSLRKCQLCPPIVESFALGRTDLKAHASLDLLA